MANVLDKTTRRRGTLRDLKTAVTARIRSKPTIEGQRYLDLYVLQRDRFRWLRLIQQAERSILSIDMALEKMGFTPGFGEMHPATGAPAETGRAAAARANKAPARRIQMAYGAIT
jgi:hypothetical protein